MNYLTNIRMIDFVIYKQANYYVYAVMLSLYQTTLTLYAFEILKYIDLRLPTKCYF